MVIQAEYLRLIPLLPLLGVLFHALLGQRLGRRAVGLVACAVVGAGFALSLHAFSTLVSAPEGAVIVDRVYRWMEVETFFVDFSLSLDPLGVLMCLVVTGVGLLIHVYSTGYMAEDPDYARYFAYLNLFTAAMLLLVMADNLVLMFVGWEGVGLCSYLLIGFWYTDSDKASAGKKAFVVNRIGDAGFLLGAFLLYWTMGDVGASGLRFEDINAHVAAFPPLIATACCLLLFLGATGKSAQIPLFVWLPDAMAGPTPVSALIHAATMVTAGVYMVARLNGLFLASPDAMVVVATIGAFTAVGAALVGVAQNDIKKVLAYSTISQLGYMFLALGVGAFGAAIFHVMTHAFFKALLFLGAGSVIHALSEQQDIRSMGGLRRLTPITHVTFVIAALAIAGVPGLAGFFSKDEILAATFDGGHYGLWAMGVFGAGLTAFYMTRLTILTFFGGFRGSSETLEHVHESPPSMTSALVVLAVLSVLGGYVGVPELLGGHNALGGFLSPVLGHQGLHMGAGLELLLMAVSVSVAVAGIAVAWRMYARGPVADEELAGRLGGLYGWMRRAWLVDEAYSRGVVKPVHGLGQWFWRGVDVGFIDALADGVATLLDALSGIWRRWATGNVQHYALSVLAGVALIVAALILEGVG